MIELVEFWKQLDLYSPPYIHPEDKPFIEGQSRIKQTIISSHKAYISHQTFSDEGDSSLHLSLLPVPYQGNLSRADIFLVMLNPGLGTSDYQTEEYNEHADQLRRIIRQDLLNVPYPFLSLNPDYTWSGGFQWWETKLRKILREIAKLYCGGDYAVALQTLSQRLAVIELFPYHSRVFKAGALRSKLPSVKHAKDFVQSLLPRARTGEITIIVSRGMKAVGIDDHELANHDPKLVRGASLSPKTKGGKAILRAFECRRLA